MKEAGKQYQKQQATTIVFNFGGSNLLARQIEEGLPTDLFVSADEAQIDRLAMAGLIDKASRRDLLTNALVIVARRDSSIQIHQLADLTGAKIARIAIANPEAVPAGIYARQLLVNARLWQGTEGKIIPAENVRAALAIVEAGDADVGIVYRTDTAVCAKCAVVLEVPAEITPKIVYPVAVVANSPHRDAANRFLDYLKSDEVLEIFQRAGFGTTK